MRCFVVTTRCSKGAVCHNDKATHIRSSRYQAPPQGPSPSPSFPSFSPCLRFLKPTYHQVYRESPEASSTRMHARTCIQLCSRRMVHVAHSALVTQAPTQQETRQRGSKPHDLMRRRPRGLARLRTENQGSQINQSRSKMNRPCRTVTTTVIIIICLPLSLHTVSHVYVINRVMRHVCVGTQLNASNLNYSVGELTSGCYSADVTTPFLPTNYCRYVTRIRKVDEIRFGFSLPYGARVSLMCGNYGVQYEV